VYQFRDARLQDRLAETCQALSEKPQSPSHGETQASTMSVSSRHIRDTS
jgi:hypothetical protein